MQTGYWKTADGKKIRICDMDNNHLINVIRFLERNGDNKATRVGKPFEDAVKPEYWLFLDELEDDSIMDINAERPYLEPLGMKLFNSQ